MNDINSRIHQVFEYYVPNQNMSAFARSIGMGFQTVKNYMYGRTPSFEFLSQILNSYPDISAEWLMRGQGSMLKTKSEVTITHQPKVESKNVEIIKFIGNQLLNLSKML